MDSNATLEKLLGPSIPDWVWIDRWDLVAVSLEGAEFKGLKFLAVFRNKVANKTVAMNRSKGISNPRPQYTSRDDALFLAAATGHAGIVLLDGFAEMIAYQWVA